MTFDEDALTTMITVVTWVLLVYYTLYNVTFLAIMLRAAVDIAEEIRWPRTVSLTEIFANPATPGVSVLVPAHNEEAGIIPAVDALRALRYPLVRIIIIDDGSTDLTFPLLREHLHLSERSVQLAAEPRTEGAIRSVWVDPSGDITVIRKESTGRRGDAINAGLRAADQELICMIDADSLLEPDALLHVVEPFIVDPTVVGVGGIVRPANGATIDRGSVISVRAPRRILENIQALEYLRAFLIGRTGWSALNGLLIISGAFGVFRKEAILAVGGLDPDTLAEDADLVISIHRHYRDTHQPARIAFVPTPVCWTEVPATARTLARQRARWSQGLGELLHKHRTMLLNPKYGAVGLLAMPYFLLFEYLGPLIGGIGFAAVLLSSAIGLTPWSLFWLIIAVSAGLGFINSATAIALDEAAYHRFAKARDALRLLLASAIEPLWYHAAHGWWRVRGIVRAITRRRSEWGTQERRGFDTQSEALNTTDNTQPDRLLNDLGTSLQSGEADDRLSTSKEPTRQSREHPEAQGDTLARIHTHSDVGGICG